MDIFIPIVICVIFFILFSVCGWCCKRKREGTVYGFGGTNVNVSSQPISASPVVVPPYPVEARHPTPHAGAPAPGFAGHHPPYPTHNPYPPTTGPTPYPPTTTPYPPTTTPYPPSTAPYPPASASGYPPAAAPYPTGGSEFSAQPPSYSEAVGQPSSTHPVPPIPSKEGYSKQAPYNPNY